MPGPHQGRSRIDHFTHCQCLAPVPGYGRRGRRCAHRAGHHGGHERLYRLGIARRTFYRWYDRFLEGGPEALEDRPSAPTRVWNRIGDDIQDQIVEMALDYSELSPRELAVRFTDEKRYFVSEATVYRMLKAHDLIASPAFIVIKAADGFHTKTTRSNEMWQTDFTYFKIIGWGLVYLSTVLDDFSRYVILWKLCTTMRAGDVTDTLELSLEASGCASARMIHKPKLPMGPASILPAPLNSSGKWAARNCRISVRNASSLV